MSTMAERPQPPPSAAAGATHAAHDASAQQLTAAADAADLLAAVFSDPRCEPGARAGTLARNLPNPATGAEPLAGALRALAAATCSEQDVEFARLFLHGRQLVAHPFESVYHSGRLHDPQCLDELARLYAQAGAHPDGSAALAPDHLAVELDFLALLLRGAADCAEASAARTTLLALAAELLDAHLVPFAAAFSARLAALDPAPPFAAAHDLLVATVALARELVAATRSSK
jgi:TorA maturation chaperone TorD